MAGQCTGITVKRVAEEIKNADIGLEGLAGMGENSAINMESKGLFHSSAGVTGRDTAAGTYNA